MFSPLIFRQVISPSHSHVRLGPLAVGRGPRHERDDDARGRGFELLARRTIYFRRKTPNAAPMPQVGPALSADEGSAGTAWFWQPVPADLGSEF